MSIKRFAFFALALIIGAFMTLIPASPASALPAGWSGYRCDDQPGNAARVCAEVYVDANGNVNWISICAYRVPRTYYNGFRGTKSNRLDIVGSNGAVLGSNYPSPTGASNEGTCVITGTGGVHVGGQAHYVAQGTMDLQLANDGHWRVCGMIYGGGC